MKKIAWLVALVLVLVVATPGGAGIIYDNTVNSTGFYIRFPGNGFVEGGDEVTLDGTVRTVTQFATQIYTTTEGTADITLRFYDGGGPGLDTPPAILLGAPITLTGVTLPNEITLVTFPVPDYVVPDNLIWTLAFSNLTGGADPGPLINDPPIIGSSDDYIWVDQGGGFFSGSFGGSPVANLSAQITVVPEASTYILFGLGALGLMVWRKRKR